MHDTAQILAACNRSGQADVRQELSLPKRAAND